MRMIAVDLDGVRPDGALWDDRGVQDCRRLPHLPITDRTIHVRWSRCVARIGKITGNLDAFIKACEQVLFVGPKPLSIRLAPQRPPARARGGRA